MPRSDIVEASVKIIISRGVFDAEFYKKDSGENSSLHPLVKHYVVEGESNGINPCPVFSSKFYTSQIPGFCQSKENALVNYLIHGSVLPIHPFPSFDPVFISNMYLVQVMHAIKYYIEESKKNNFINPNRFLWGE